MEESLLIEVQGAYTDGVHDGHSSHYEGTPKQRFPVDNYQRALELNRNPIIYPSRVRVW